MKHLEEIRQQGIVASAKLETSNLINPNSEKLVNAIFAKMGLLLRGFNSYYADRARLSAEKTQWALALSKREITHYTQILAGLKRLEEYTYPNPPQLGEFLSWIEGDGAKQMTESEEKALLTHDELRAWYVYDSKMWGKGLSPLAWKQQGMPNGNQD